MDVNTWDDFVQYVWRSNSGETELYTEIEDDNLYYYLVDDEKKRLWLSNISSIDVSLLKKGWEPVRESPLCPSPLTQHEKVCRKIALMEKRWLAFQDVKRLQQRKQHV